MSMDIVPTVAEAAGASLPEGYTVDGASALPVLASGATTPHKAIFWHQYGQMAVRKGDWKLVVKGRVYDRRDDGSKPLEGEDAVFLANVRDDPGEAKNLRRVHPAVVDELMTLIHDWRKTMPAAVNP
jgi:arylsulfatase A-like enzyme